MKWGTLGSKQLLAMTWWNRKNFSDLDGIICHGAVRSGKTMALTCGFFLWSMASFDNQVFALCGKTVVLPEDADASVWSEITEAEALKLQEDAHA